MPNVSPDNIQCNHKRQQLINQRLIFLVAFLGPFPNLCTYELNPKMPTVVSHALRFFRRRFSLVRVMFCAFQDYGILHVLLQLLVVELLHRILIATIEPVKGCDGDERIEPRISSSFRPTREHECSKSDAQPTHDTRLKNCLQTGNFFQVPAHKHDGFFRGKVVTLRRILFHCCF
uniref:Putative rna binding protein n=1 Tax=Ixodes ricinus TaxID=34613 RepID=A0A0K8RGV8_IXORI